LWSLQPKNFVPEALSVSPNGESVAVAGILSVIPPNAQLANVDVIKHEPTIYIVNLQQQSIVQTLKGKTVGPLAWSPDGSRLALAGGAVEIFDVRSGQRVLQEHAEKASHTNVRYTPDGRYFIESDMNGLGTGLGVKIWDAAHEKVLQEIPGDVGSIAVSRDSKFVAIGSAGDTTIWAVK
jgi:WD40 repeat protein